MEQVVLVKQAKQGNQVIQVVLAVLGELVLVGLLALQETLVLLANKVN